MLTVIIAFAANLLIALAKSVAAFITGSPSMTAEAAHSWADTGNEIFLLVANKRSAKERDRAHPLGYGREAYVWSMFAAFGLFSVGAAVSITHGVQSLIAPESATNFAVAYIVLAAAVVLEGVSFLQAFRQVRKAATESGRDTLEQVLTSSDTTLRAVFAEDAAALIGLAIAFLGVLLHQLTGSSAYDAIGSILIGVLLGVVALILIDRNRRFLVGQVTHPDIRREVLRQLLARDKIDRVTYLHLEIVGPSRLYLVAAVDLTGNEVESNVAERLRALERELERDEHIEEAVLTLAIRDEESLTVADADALEPD